MGGSDRGTGKWAQPGVPHKGWSCVGFEDLGEPSATCEMRELQDIRYIHYMVHPNYPHELGCGCICASKMEEDYEGARRRETRSRSTGSRRRRWLAREWRVSSKGNAYLNVDGYNVVVYRRGIYAGRENWGFRVTNRTTSVDVKSKRPYPTKDAAKLGSFDAMIWMKEQGR